MAREELRRRKGNEWVTLEVELGDGGRLSICGSAGEVMTRAAAKKAARESWENFFADDPAELGAFAVKWGKRTPKSAAAYVVKIDGEFHGLDVTDDAGAEVYTMHSGGQITDTLREWFPEIAHWLPWHLNDMKAGCLHQEALGWGHGRDVALDAQTMTGVQHDALLNRNIRRVADARARALKLGKERVRTDRRYRLQILTEVLGEHPSVFDDEAASGAALNHAGTLTGHGRELLEKIDAHLSTLAENAHPVAPVVSEVFTNSLMCPCPVCGYAYGSAWLKRELPAEIRAEVEAFISTGTLPALVEVPS
jgi:hypothetical protein